MKSVGSSVLSKLWHVDDQRDRRKEPDNANYRSRLPSGFSANRVCGYRDWRVWRAATHPQQGGSGALLSRSAGTPTLFIDDTVEVNQGAIGDTCSDAIAVGPTNECEGNASGQARIRACQISWERMGRGKAIPPRQPHRF